MCEAEALRKNQVGSHSITWVNTVRRIKGWDNALYIWFKNDSVLRNATIYSGRSPHGERGLKSISVRPVPVNVVVAPRTGSVD